MHLNDQPTVPGRKVPPHPGRKLPLVQLPGRKFLQVQPGREALIVHPGQIRLVHLGLFHPAHPDLKVRPKQLSEEEDE